MSSRARFAVECMAIDRTGEQQLEGNTRWYPAALELTLNHSQHH
jgi:hypothetical protein